MANRKPFCWFCRTAIADPMTENPEDCAYVEITCRECHVARKDYYAEIYIPMKTTIVVASNDWSTWKTYLDLHQNKEMESLEPHFSEEGMTAFRLAASETNMGDDIPEDEQGLSCFDIDPEEYVIVTKRLEVALAALLDGIRSGDREASDQQLEYVLGLDLCL